MSQLSKRRFWDALLRKNRRLQSNSHIRLARRRKLSIQRLELRELLAVITWDSTKSTGFWDVPSNWIGGVLPGANDDVVIGNQIVTYRTGTTTVKSITAGANFLMTGGTLTGGTISQDSGDFRLSGGTLNSSTLSVGNLQATSGTIQNVTIASGSVLNIPGQSSILVTSNSKLTIAGTANFEAGSTLTLNQTGWNTTSDLVVANGGIVNATGSVFTKSGSYLGNTSITVQNGGRLRATGSTFATGLTRLANDAVFQSDDWTRNKFDQSIYVPAKIVQALSNAAGTATQNIRFENIYINAGTWTTGVLDLKAIGSETT
ncbi:MAG: hypothetical protein ACK5PB_17060, partial [Pirellula sp.]